MSCSSCQSVVDSRIKVDNGDGCRLPLSPGSPSVRCPSPSPDLPRIGCYGGVLQMMCLGGPGIIGTASRYDFGVTDVDVKTAFLVRWRDGYL